jgi:glycosyltransferase involved in cell wall biosynthesis
LAEFDPDVVHIHHLFGLSPRFILLAHRLKIPVVVSLHDFYFACPRITLRKTSGEVCDGPDGGLECASTCYAGQGQEGVVRWGLRAQYFRTLLQFPARFVSPSRHMAGFFESFGVPADRIRVVPNGVAVDLIGRAPVERSPRERRHLKIAYLGTVVEHKGVHVLLEALRLAKLPRASLVIAGHIAEEAYGKRLVDEAASIPGLELQMHGTYEIEDLPGLLGEVDVLAIPSQWPETFAIVAREAFIRGVPVVAARIGGLQEAVEDGENGFLFEPDRPDDLAGILRRLAGDDELLTHLREGALRTPVLSVTDNAVAVREVYEEAIAEAAPTPAPAFDEQLRYLHAASVGAGFASVG